MGGGPAPGPAERRPTLRPSSRRRTVLVAVLTLAGLSLLVPVVPGVVRRPARAQVSPTQPDVIVILTDDQRSDTMRFMPFISGFFRTDFVNGFITNPVCCPARTAIMTGTYSYTNGVWTNDPPWGGWPQFQAHGWADRSIATALQSAGYATGLFGKFLNAWDDTLPSGWTRFSAHAAAGLHGWGTPYYNYTLRNGDGSYEDHGGAPQDYAGDVLTTKAVDFIAAYPNQPHFTYLALNAPHSVSGSKPPVPGPGFENLPVQPFADTPNFLEADVSDKPLYVQESKTRTLAEYRRWNKRYARSLMTTDAEIRDLVGAQEARDPGLHHTDVFLLSDNGLLIGNHRRLGKSVPYEEAIHVPFLARGDGFPTGTVKDLVSNVDIVPTILELTGASATWGVEGESLLAPTDRRYVLIQGAARSHGYCGVRLHSQMIVRYRSGEWEYYNLVRDPYELRNRPDSPAALRLMPLATAACEGKLPPAWPRPSL
jgi:arylsulfatase A-like enzyme